MENAFEMKKLVKTYGPLRVLDIESEVFHAGRITALVGPNGCGKTTLLECLDGLQKPDSGTIHYYGAPVSRASRRRMTLVFQSPYLFNSTVEYNVAYGLRARGKRDRAAVDEALKSVRLEGFNRRNAKKLSGGESKRVALARALAFQPETLLLDELTANIDSENVAIIEDTIRGLCEGKGATVIMATHSRSQAARLAHRILLIQDGRLVPYHPDNHFKGTLSGRGDEIILTIAGGPSAVVSTGRPDGPVSCTIPPEEIIISTGPLKSSARNCWEGRVTAVALANGRVRITCDAGVPIVATITKASYDNLRPAIGDVLYLTFKASSVQIF